MLISGRNIHIFSGKGMVELKSRLFCAFIFSSGGCHDCQCQGTGRSVS